MNNCARSMGAMASAAVSAGSATVNYAASAVSSSMSPMSAQTKRYHAYNASFSRRTTVRQISEFLSQRLHVKREDMRLWNFKVSCFIHT